MTDNVVWQPQPGPQSALLACPVFEVFFGGARGGGKTDGMLGDFIVHADQYGENAIGLMVRRQRTELIETMERSRQLYLPLGAKFNEQEKYWRFPNGARLRFAYLERDADADAYQGHSYCVAVGTRIRMADGSLKPIEWIRPGELVATLEGPRRVSASTPPYVAPCVEAVVRDSSGSVLGRQRHPVWHPILTTSGLISSLSARAYGSAGRPRSGRFSDDRRDRGFQPCDRREIPAWHAWSGDGRSDCTGLQPTLSGSLRLRSLTVPVVLHAPAVRSVYERGRAGRTGSILSRVSDKWSALSSGLSRGWRRLGSRLERLAAHARQVLDRCFPCPANVLASAPSDLSAVRDFRSGCLSGRDFGDARALWRSGSARGALPSPTGAGNMSPAWLLDGSDTIRPHSHLGSTRWVHPYTGEERRLLEEVTSGTMELTPCGSAWVADLTVEGANHYISECGLVNKNTRLYVEEIGSFPSRAPIAKLMATLRSGAGVPVGFRATGNPGGPGHQHVKARYIDPCPSGWRVMTEEFVDPWSGAKVTRDRVFIPSKLADNKYLGAEYVANLQMVGSTELVRAWLEGDWDIVEGAFFDGWSHRKHVLRPFTVPREWLRFRAMDWGYASPASIGWWAVVQDDFEHPADGRLLPRGAMVRYREWYVASAPGVGARFDAERVAAGILSREADDEAIAYGVLDPAAFSEDGGPSIAERMARAGVRFKPADNRRIAKKGAIGGWDAMRARLRGISDTPMIFCFETCADSIRTIPVLQHDRDRPEDLDTDAEDHAADEWRYACMSRPWMPKTAKAPREKKHGITMNELWEQRLEAPSRIRV